MPAKKQDAEAPFVRRKCSGCNHAESFHPDHEECCAFGCSCEGWKDPETTKAPKAKASKAKAK